LGAGFDPIAGITFAAYYRSMTERPPKSPQQKKSLSYAKDRRNTYGENDKASRKAIPARKAGESRKVRRKARQSLETLDHVDELIAEVVESSLRHDLERVGGWKKSPDEPLADYIAHQARLRSLRSLNVVGRSLQSDN
jgi:hypothetical protein